MKKVLIPASDEAVKPHLPVFVLRGIGGAGKSEAAIKFAAENQDSFWGVFWIDADNKQSIEQGFAEIAKMQTPPLLDTGVKAVLQGLAATQKSWLLVLDNCDDREIDFSHYLPSRGGSVIITTRLIECQILGVWENLDNLGQDVAIELLLDASGVGVEDQNTQRVHAGAVVSILGQHALALVHTGAYIQKGHCSLEEYCRLFHLQQNNLMRFRPTQQASRYGSVYTTFEVSAIALASASEHDSHLALKLLNILAFLDREGVDEQMFLRAFERCQDLEEAWNLTWSLSRNEDECSDPHVASASEPGNSGTHFRNTSSPVADNVTDSSNDVQAMCCARGTYRLAATTINSHELASDVTKVSSLKTCSDGSKDCVPDVGNTTNGSVGGYDDGDIDHLDTWHCERIRLTGLVGDCNAAGFRAARVCLSELSLIRVDNGIISMHPLVHEWARTRLTTTARQDAWEETLCMLALSIEKETSWHPSSASLRPHIEACFRNRGTGRLQIPTSLNVARCLYLLAWQIYFAGGNETSLSIFDILSEQCDLQPDTWSAKSEAVLLGKAACLRNLDRYGEMQGCAEQIVASRAKWFKSDDIEVFEGQTLLAQLYCQTGKLAEAVYMLEHLVEQRSRTAKLKEEDCVDQMWVLAQAHAKLGNNKRAAELLEDEIVIKTRSSPLESPFRINTMISLAKVYMDMGKSELAVTLLKDLVKLKSSPQSPSNMYRMHVMDALAQVYLDLEQPLKARELLEEVVEYWSRSRLPDDPARLTSMDRLAATYIHLGEPALAVSLLEEVCSLKTTKYLPHDRTRLVSMDRLSEAYLDLGRHNEAAALLEMVVLETTRHLPQDRIRLVSMDRLSQAYLALGRHNEAAALLETVVLETTTSLPQDRIRLVSMDRLSQAYLDLGRHNEAAALLETVVDLSSQSLPCDDTSRLISLQRLATAYIEFDDACVVGKAISLLEQVIDLGSNTFHSDLEELAFTEELLGRAKLKHALQTQQVLPSLTKQTNDDGRETGTWDSLLDWTALRLTSKAALMF